MSFQLIIAFWFDRRKKSKFDTRMRETMAKKTVQQDAASDQEETRRTRDSLSIFALERNQSVDMRAAEERLENLHPLGKERGCARVKIACVSSCLSGTSPLDLK